MASALSKQERQERLAAVIFGRGSVRIDDLLDEIGVSAMTLYRDLADLEARQVLTRSRGEVQAAASSLSETSFTFRLGHEAAAKRGLASLAADLVGRGDSVLVDDSTTAHFVLDEVLGGGPVTVVTNCQPAAALAMEATEAELIMLGGRYLPRLQAYYGPTATGALRQVRVDVAVLGAAAIQTGMVFHPYQDVAEFKRLALRRAHLSVLVVTASKFARTALYEVCALTDFDVIVTDEPLDSPALAAAREAGVRMLGQPAAAKSDR